MLQVKFNHAALALALVYGAPALAQNTEVASSGAETGGVLEEVVVTSQKRRENVQNVPIAVTAFSSEMLVDKNIAAVQGLGNLTPNVTLDAGSPFSGSTSVLTAYIRGIGQDDFAFNLDPGVGIYLDGVYLARTVGANTDLLDVERIEVLKGPQGTLFGRNSIGGAISIVTREPGDTFGGRAEVTTGRFNRADVRGSVDLPLIDNVLLSSITFSTSKRDGYVRRIPYDTGNTVNDPANAFPRSGFESSNREGGDDQWTTRAKLLWRASDRTKVTVAADYQKVDQAGMATTLLDAFPLEGFPGELFGTAYNLCINVPNNLLPTDIGGNIQAMCGIRGTVGTSFGNANVDTDPNNNRLPYDNRFLTDNKDTSYATGPSFSRLKNWGVSGVADFALNDSVAIKSITAYRELAWLAGMDTDGSPVAIIEPGFQMDQRQTSEELQFTGQAFANRLNYVFGGYYFQESGNLHDYVPFGQGLLQIDGNNVFDTQTWAAFTHLNFHFTDRLSATLGARYTNEQKKFEGFQRDPNGFLYKLVLGKQLDQITDADRIALGFPDPSDPLRFYPPGTNSKSFSNFSPRVGFEFRPTEDVMLYTSFSQGYKTGGWTTRLSNPESVAPDFDEEKADSYELGVKSELLGHRLRVNVATFFTDYSGIQLTQTNGISPTTRNAGDAEIYGFELELQAVPTDALLLVASVGYLHDEYKRKLAGTTAGDELPKTPEWKFNFSPKYTLNVGTTARVVANADYTYTASMFNNTENTLLLRRDAVNMLNASLTYERVGEKWSVTLGATNLLDDRYLTTGQFQPGGGVIYGTYSRPTEWYAKLGVKF